MVEEIERQTKSQGEKLEWQADQYIELALRIKTKSAVVTRELAEMGDLFRAFQKKHEADGKTVFTKTLQFYLDALNSFDYNKIKVALDDEVQKIKKQIDQTIALKAK